MARPCPAPALISVPLARSTQRTSSLTLASGDAVAAGGAPELLRRVRRAAPECRRRLRQLHRDADVLDHQRELERVVEAGG